MTTLALLETIKARGVTIRAQGEALYVKPLRLVRDLDSDIREHRPALLLFLQKTHGDTFPSDASGAPEYSGSRFDAGAAFRDYQASGPHATAEELPPALIECPGLTLNGAGLWIRPDGFIKVTPGTLPAIVEHCRDRQAAKMAMQQVKEAA